MRVVLAGRAILPNAAVGLAPVSADILAEMEEHLLRFAIQLATTLYKVGNGLDHFAIHVELELNPCVIADANRAGAGIACEVREHPFFAPISAEDIVENLQLRASEARGMQHPTDKRRRLLEDHASVWVRAQEPGRQVLATKLALAVLAWRCAHGPGGKTAIEGIDFIFATAEENTS